MYYNKSWIDKAQKQIAHWNKLLESVFEHLLQVLAKTVSLAQSMNHYQNRLVYYEAIWEEMLNLK